MYKFPQIKHEPKLIKGGLAYMYITSNSSKEWELSKISILHENSLLGLTLAPLITNQVNNNIALLEVIKLKPIGKCLSHIVQ